MIVMVILRNAVQPESLLCTVLKRTLFSQTRCQQGFWWKELRAESDCHIRCASFKKRSFFLYIILHLALSKSYLHLRNTYLL